MAAIIDEVLRVDPGLAGRSHRVFLSEPDNEATLVLDQPVMSSKVVSGRPVGWTLGPKPSPWRRLRARRS